MSFLPPESWGGIHWRMRAVSLINETRFLGADGGPEEKGLCEHNDPMMMNLNYVLRKYQQISISNCHGSEITSIFNSKYIIFTYDIYNSWMSPLTCAGGGGGVLDGPVEAFVTMTNCASLVMAGAMQRTNGALMVPSVGLEESWLASCRKRHRGQLLKLNLNEL